MFDKIRKALAGIAGAAMIAMVIGCGGAAMSAKPEMVAAAEKAQQAHRVVAGDRIAGNNTQRVANSTENSIYVSADPVMVKRKTTKYAKAPTKYASVTEAYEVAQATHRVVAGSRIDGNNSVRVVNATGESVTVSKDVETRQKKIIRWFGKPTDVIYNGEIATPQGASHRVVAGNRIDGNNTKREIDSRDNSITLSNDPHTKRIETRRIIIKK